MARTRACSVPRKAVGDGLAAGGEPVIGELDAIVGEHRVDLIRDGLHELVEELSGATPVAFAFSRAKA
jgi:hypothetical protein